MTRTIDTHYLLDEIELLGMLVERIATDIGLIHDHPSRDQLTAALFQELRDRRDTRRRLAGQGPRVARSTVDADPFERMEQILAALRVLPTSDAMRMILAAHDIRRAAEEMNIDQHLIHAGVASGNAVLRDVYPNAGDRVSIDQLTPEEREEYIELCGPYLPEPIRSQWRAKVATISDQYDQLGDDEIVECYEGYLQWVLDSYAVGTAQGSGPVARYNERDHSTSLIPVYKDTFWRRSAKIVPNPQYNPTAKTTNPSHLIEIEFEPRDLDLTDFVISLWDTRTGTPPQHIQELIGAVKEGYHFVAVESRGMHGEDPIRMAVGRTVLEAYTVLVVGERNELRKPMRPMTEAEQRELTEAAHDPRLQTDHVKTEPSPRDEMDRFDERNRYDLVTEIIDRMSNLSLAELWGLHDALVAHVKYGLPEKHEFIANKHFEPTPRYSIHLSSQDPITEGLSRVHKVIWRFSNAEWFREHCRILSGLAKLRGVAFEKNDDDDEYNSHYPMPYTWAELVTIFGSMEELT